jgi:hypothetical protein
MIFSNNMLHACGHMTYCAIFYSPESSFIRMLNILGIEEINIHGRKI